MGVRLSFSLSFVNPNDMRQRPAGRKSDILSTTNAIVLILCILDA